MAELQGGSREAIDGTRATGIINGCIFLFRAISSLFRQVPCRGDRLTRIGYPTYRLTVRDQRMASRRSASSWRRAATQRLPVETWRKPSPTSSLPSDAGAFLNHTATATGMFQSRDTTPLLAGLRSYVSKRLHRSQKERLRYYRQRFLSAQRSRFDLYMLFIEQALDLLKPGGRLAFILSNSFLRSKGGRRNSWIHRGKCLGRRGGGIRRLPEPTPMP